MSRNPGAAIAYNSYLRIEKYNNQLKILRKKKRRTSPHDSFAKFSLSFLLNNAAWLLY